MPYPLPKDTAKDLKDSLKGCQNLGLLLDRFLEADKDWGLPVEVKKRSHVSPGFRGELTRLLTCCGQRHEAIRHSYRAKGYAVEEIEAKCEYRLVVGFGAEHVLETNLCLHRIHGFPLVPGSAVKGLTRAFAFWELADQFKVPEANLRVINEMLTKGTDKEQQKTWTRLNLNRPFADWQNAARAFYSVFGTMGQKGRVLFFDAYPTKTPRLEVDVLNPHYGKYYQGQGTVSPADYLTPVPGYFLTVGRGCSFLFAVASKETHLAVTAKRWLTNGLTELGIGAKTSAGYGFMEV